MPFIFRKTKFYAITIRAKRNRPANFLLKYLYNFVILDRSKLSKRNSSYLIQHKLINKNIDYEKNLIINKSIISHTLKYPNNFVFFHYKHNLFNNLLKWDFKDINKLINFLSDKYENLIFSSEIYNEKFNNLFSSLYNTNDYNKNITNKINNKNILFLKDIDGYDLFDAISKSNQIIAPEGIITHMGYFLKKPVLALMHFNLSNKQDFINQLISCREWFPPDNYNYTVLKKNLNDSLKKLTKRI